MKGDRDTGRNWALVMLGIWFGTMFLSFYYIFRAAGLP